MTSFAFVLGNTPELSIAEIESAVPYSSKNRLTDEILEISSDKIIPEELINKLGGTVKIAKFITQSNDIYNFDITSCFENTQKIDFGISVYGQNINIKKVCLNTKRNFERKGVKSRFVLPKDNSLSSVVVSKQKLQELIIVKDKIFKTVAVQDFEDWNKRDYGRPCADPASGMLPPKVARMMVNLVRSKGGLLLDPFCGVGTILSESLLMGFDVIGSDNSPKAIEFSRKNLDWIAKEYKIKNKYDVFAMDARNVSLQSIDAIVTETFMGPLSPTYDAIGNIIKDLEGLYISCLKNWYGSLKKDGIIVIAFPSFNLNGLEFRVKSPIDMVGELGYTLLQGPITYSRPQAIVKRNIYKFIKN